MTATSSPSSPPPANRLRSPTNSRPRRLPWLIGLLVLAFLAILVLAGASGTQEGSTYTAGPTGYQKWYAYMQKQNTVPIERWRRSYTTLTGEEDPNDELLESHLPPGSALNSDLVPPVAPPAVQPVATPLRAPETMIRVHAQVDPLTRGRLPAPLITWVEQGNRVIQLGWWGETTAAKFQSQLPSSVGPVQIETIRRANTSDAVIGQKLLKDKHGAVVWQNTYGKGQIIYVTYPWLAANAHENDAKNFAYLGNLASQAGGKIWIDEWMHGFRDTESQTSRQREIADVFAYILRTTPALAMLCQAGLIGLIALFGLNWRFGPPVSLVPPEPANSERYVQALATVLNQARHTDFVAAQLSLRLRQQLASELGLAADRAPSARLPDDDSLAKAWAAQTGRPPEEVLKLLQQAKSGKRWSDLELQAWAAAAASVEIGKGGIA
jgi:hypothetical protein